MKTSATNRKVRVLLNAIKDGNLQPRPEFQRRLVWSTKHKLAFLKTVLGNYPFPEIYIASGEVNPDTGTGIEMLVDGQQRIDTLYQYFHDTLEIKPEGAIPRYSELDKDQKLNLLEYEVVIRDLGSIPIQEIKEVFNKINSTNYSLNAMEIDNSRFEGELKKFAENLSTNAFFDVHKIFTNNEIKRMLDVRYTLSIIITLMTTYFNRDSDIEKYLEVYNDELPNKDELKYQIDYILKLIEDLDFNEKSRVWKKNDLFTLIVELHRGIFKSQETIDTKITSHNLNNFYNNIDAINTERGRHLPELYKDYREAVTNASNDRKNRITRGSIIYELIFNNTIG